MNNNNWDHMKRGFVSAGAAVSEQIFFGSFFYIFFLFLKFAFYQKNIFIFGNTVMLMSFFIPLLPKGSFFTNWNAMIFWTVFGLNLYLMSQKTNKNINK